VGSDRVLMIGLDAADLLLVDRWIEEGHLPNLRRMMESGVSGRLQTSARYLVGSPWPTFFTGVPPTRHGIYHDFQWQHEGMCFARPAWEWLPALPFWRRMEPQVQVLSYDVPFLMGVHEAAGTEVVGFASHDRIVEPLSHPPEALQEVEREFGRIRMLQEDYGVSDPEYLLGLRDFLLEVTRHSTRASTRFLQKPWDLAIVVLGALHRGGHRLWDRSSASRALSAEEGEAFDRALMDLYIECDSSVGRMIEAAGDATVIVFALHGMMINACRNDFLDAMLARVLGGMDADPPRHSVVRRLGEALPLGLRRGVTQRIPTRLRDRIMTSWATGGTDWSHTEAFTLRADLQGYVRINLIGREAEGIVSGAEYDALCDRLADGLMSFRDADTGDPVVAEVRRPVDVYGRGEREARVPDLVVRWVESTAAAHVALFSEEYGRVERETPGRIPNGRSGNHRTEGFFVARGQGIPEGSRLAEAAHIMDLPPTVLRLLGVSCRDELAGTPIPINGQGPDGSART
jgi:predicted AlkP superfamily phosphohydrolase/phosphomutase